MMGAPFPAANKMILLQGMGNKVEVVAFFFSLSDLSDPVPSITTVKTRAQLYMT